MEVVHLESANAQLSVFPAHGSRIGSLVVKDTLIFVESALTPFDWGCYPMVPFAGRLRDAKLIVGDASYSLPANDPSGLPHAIHGTVFDASWNVDVVTSSRAEMSCALTDPWPFRGDVRHVVELDDASLTCTLSLTTRDEMPAMLGWHPWFLKPQSVSLPFRTMMERDDHYLPSGLTIPVNLENADDCFTDLDGAISITIGSQTLHLQSDCTHWVVYNQPSHATCIEPQSGPPNEVNDAPFVLAAGDTMTRQFVIRW